ncbi:MAG: MATE family efflux transporter [Pseudomonadota bacterium]
MAGGRERDLTAGSIPGHFRALAVPSAVGMLFTTLYNVVDMFYAGLISTDALAGLSISFQAFFILISFGFGLGIGLSSLIGNALGARDRPRAARYAGQGITFAAILSGLLFVAGLFLAPLMLRAIGGDTAYAEAAVDYTNLLLFATPGFLVAFTANGICSAQGDTVSLQRAQIAAFFANLALNPLFIYGIPGLVPGIGFDGIALSTVVSQTGVMLWMLRRAFGSDLMQVCGGHDFRPRLERIMEIVEQAFPASFSMLVMMIGGVIVQFYLKPFGADAVAAYGVALRVEQILILPGIGLTSALLPIAAQNYGAGDFDRVRGALFFCLKAGMGLMSIAAILVWTLGGTMMGVFAESEEVVRLGVQYLTLDGFMLPLYSAMFAMTSFQQALKRPLWPVYIGLYRQIAAIAAFGWIYVVWLDLGTWGVWLAIFTAVSTGFVLAGVVTLRIAGNRIGGLSPAAQPA